MTRALMLLALAAVGCGSSRTEVVVVVETEGLGIPADIDALHVTVADKATATVLFDSQAVALCHGALTTGCHDFPITLTLIPGGKQPDDPVRVDVQALLGTQVIIDDAATFTFVAGQSSRLDFVLFPACLNSDCAASDRVCGADGQCTAIVPQPLHGEPDLAVVHAGDDGGVTDEDMAMTAPADMAQAAPPDMVYVTRSCGQASFGGTATSVISAPHLPAYNPSGSFTVEAWVYPTAFPVGGHADIAAHQASGLNKSWELYLDNTGAVSFSLTYDGSTFMTLTGPILVKNQWTLVSAEFETSNQVPSLYINGQRKAITNWTGFLSVRAVSAPLTIGNSAAGDAPFTGLVDELRYSNVQIYSQGVTAFQPPMRLGAGSSTLALYHLDDTAGSAADSSTAANTAVVGGGAALVGPAPGRACIVPHCGYVALPAGAHLDAAYNALLNFPGSWTVELWFYGTDATPSGGGGFPTDLVWHANTTNASNMGWDFYFSEVNNAQLDYPVVQMVCPNGAATATPVASGVTQLVWHHLAAQFDATAKVLTVYADGHLVSTSATLGCTAPKQVLEGMAMAQTENSGFSSEPHALFDEMRLSSVVRYTADFDPVFVPFTPDADTVALYHFDDAAGATFAADASGNAISLGVNGSGTTFNPTSCW